MDSQRAEAKLSTGSTASNVSSTESDSGLSGLDDTHSLSIASTSTRDVSKSPNSMKHRLDSVSLVDSGRRTQSLEVLSDDLASLELSPGSRRSPKGERHAHFADELERSRGVSSPALSAPPTTGNHINLPNQTSLRKSLSIPVHLTVSKQESSALPYSLRPDPFCDVPHHRRHEADCATQVVPGTCPRALNLLDDTDRDHGTPKSKMHWKSTPFVGGTLPHRRTAVSASPVHNKHKSQSAINGSSESVRSRVPLHDIDPSYNGHRARASSSNPGKSQHQPRRPVKPTPGGHSENGYMRSTKSSANRVSQKRRSLMPKAMNASMEIWEIQRELKRGEMVQGVLKIGRPSQNEPCICAPVMIGRADGHMHWRSM